MKIYAVFLVFLYLINTSLSINLNVVVHYPVSNLQSSNIYLRGDGCGLNWSSGQLMASSNQNEWLLSLTYDSSSVGNTLQLKALIDDSTWMIGANALVILPQTSSTVDLYPFFYSQQGSYNYIRNVYSPQLKNYRDLVIYTPPSFNENTLKVYSNVLVMHDGQNLFNTSTAFNGVAWDCQDTVNSLIVNGQMDEIVIIGVDNTPDRINELTYSYDPSEQAGGKGDLYLDFITQSVIPTVIKAGYRINVEQPTLGILGSSLGGLISCYAGWTRNDVYGKAGCMSSSFWWNSEDFNTIIMNKTQPQSATLTVYLDSGDSGEDNDDEAQTQRVLQHFIDDGWQKNSNLFYYLDQGGQHSEYYWGRRFHVPMVALYPPTPLPTN